MRSETHIATGLVVVEEASLPKVHVQVPYIYPGGDMDLA